MASTAPLLGGTIILPSVYAARYVIGGHYSGRIHQYVGFRLRCLLLGGTTILPAVCSAKYIIISHYPSRFHHHVTFWLHHRHVGLLGYSAHSSVANRQTPAFLFLAPIAKSITSINLYAPGAGVCLPWALIPSALACSHREAPERR